MAVIGGHIRKSRRGYGQRVVQLKKEPPPAHYRKEEHEQGGSFFVAGPEIKEFRNPSTWMKTKEKL